ncbi:MAG TPA: hypothetical protein QF423_05805 [Candidatus Scalindua sp.]|jgi:hypothetical protein|nr:hypothetical protein [Candidatus Scalindua sp.]|tara:strand:- start:577 stop:789 length:213 start_codon:yes stop_codon:yes gene_type:complete
MEDKKLTASEALYGFCAWLTTSKEVTEMGSSKDSAPVVDLIERFVKANQLEEPREDYCEILTYPKESQGG